MFNRAGDETELLGELTCLYKLSHFTQGMTGEVRQAAQRTIHLGCRPFGHMLNEGFKLRMRRFPREIQTKMWKLPKAYGKAAQESQVFQVCQIRNFMMWSYFPLGQHLLLLRTFASMEKKSNYLLSTKELQRERTMSCPVKIMIPFTKYFRAISGACFDFSH